MSKPVVATDVGEVNFAIEDKINGFLCKEGDLESFAEAIVRLSKNDTLRKNMGFAGREKAITELSWDIHVTNVLSNLKAKIETG